MDDIAPELLAKVEKKFQDLRLRDRDLLALIQRCVQPGATQADVAAYSERLGELLGAALTEEVGPDVLPGGRLHLNIAKKLVDPLLRDAHLMVNKQAADVQRQIDKADKVGMTPAEAEYPARRLQDLYWTACDPANDDPLGMIARQTPTAVRRFHDDFIQTNAEARYQAGMRPTVERECEAKACTWCRDRAGSWDYESVRRGGEVFQRHENCRCTVTFINGKERQDVHTKKRWEADDETEAARIAASDAAGERTPSDEVKTQRRAAGAKTPRNDADKRAERITYSQEKAAALKEKREKGVANPAGSGIITTKVDNGYAINPMDAEKYHRMRDNLEARGIHVIQAQGDDLRYLYSLGAEATYGHGYIMHIGEIPSASGFFEEVIHSTQAKKYGEFTGSDPVELYAREIAANRMLLRYHKAYGFDDIDVEDITRNLKTWESKFLRVTGVTYDESSIKREI